MNFRNFFRFLVISAVFVYTVIQLVTDAVGCLARLTLAYLRSHIHAFAFDELNFGVHFLDFILSQHFLLLLKDG
jgi:hypothetical protein